jgi:hypothetical protein
MLSDMPFTFRPSAQEHSKMTFVDDWGTYEQELADELKKMLQANKKSPESPAPPKEVVALLKTADLKAALKLADESVAKKSIDGMRKAQAKTQKFFLMYANQFKLAKVATQAKPELADLNDLLNMFNAYMTRTQVGVASKTAAMLSEAKQAEKDTDKLKILEIKSALSPLKFMYDWKASKRDFENETGLKKPSAKIMNEYRKSAGLDPALDEMDKACQKFDPAAYRKAYAKFDIAHSNYASVLEKALVSEKSADEKYKRKVGGLKDVLKSIDSRAKEKLQMLDKLGV